MKKNDKLKRLFSAIHPVKSSGRPSHLVADFLRFLTFFLLMCFILTSCMFLFMNVLQDKIGIEWQKDNIQEAARLTFLNVIFLSSLFCAVDAIRRRYMVDRPVNKIIQAAEKIMNGDLSVRIEKEHSVDPNNGFNVIIDYFNRMTEELSGMETLRTDFIANVSHELKTPLAVMQNYGTLLQNPQLPEAERMEYAKAIIDASRNMAGMISNILKLNKLENQNIYPDTKTYNLGEQLCECLLGFEDVWEKKGIEIEADVEEQVLVKADPELLTLVWNNLFSNAIKFTDPGGKVKVTLNAQNEEAVVRISDTGCGITPEVGKHIFEKFYQGDTSHVTKGNGLGLALVKRVMDITKGDIQVSSEVGKGSTFTVRLRRERDGTV
jgi:signal transduction histidine kinase